MRFFSTIARCIKRSDFHRTFSSDVKLNKSAIALNIIGSGAPGESPSISLSICNHDKYLFNCGEDCQRLLTDQNRKISQINHIFVTQVKWKCIGGISGISRIIQTWNGLLPMYHGPKQLYKCLKRILCLSILSELDFKPIDCNLKSFYEDDDLRVDFISVIENKTNNENSRLRDINEVIVYVAEVKSHASPVHFMILDLPTKEHVEAFITKKHHLKQHFDIVVHFSSDIMIKSKEYQSLISSLVSKKHLYLNENHECSRLRSVYELQMRLNEIDEKVHPPLKMPLDFSRRVCDMSKPQNDDKNSTFFSTYHLNGEIENKQLSKNSDETLNSFEFQQNFDMEHLKLYPKIVFLGTVSAEASSIRNNTSILVHTTRNDSILFDCGEGTCSQIHRLYGKNAFEIIRKIKAVFISHMHYDHHGGLVELMEMRRKYMPSDRSKLMLLSPKADLKSWLFFYDTNIDAIHDDLYLIDNDSLMSKGLSSSMCRKLGIDMLQTCRVPHYNITHAITMCMGQSDRFKLTFSSDTTPCDDLIALGQNSTLIIHEATYTDELNQKAKLNRHCTVSQAIEQCRQMNAKYSVLTHFSKRQKFPYVDSEKHKNIGIAFDFMQLTIHDLPKLSSLNEKYQILFNKNESDKRI